MYKLKLDDSNIKNKCNNIFFLLIILTYYHIKIKLLIINFKFFKVTMDCSICQNFTA